MFHLKLFEYENKCKLTPKGVAVQLLPKKGRNVTDLLSPENVYLVSF